MRPPELCCCELCRCVLRGEVHSLPEKEAFALELGWGCMRGYWYCQVCFPRVRRLLGQR